MVALAERYRGDMTRRRLIAAAALVCGVGAIVLAAVVAVGHFPRGVIALAGLALSLGAGWYGATRRGVARALGLGAAVVLVVGVVILVVARDPIVVLTAVAGVWLSLAASRAAFRVHVPLPRAPRPTRPVLFYNPRSGGGKATRLHLPEEARRRGIEPIELTPGGDLAALVRDAVSAGADALAMAGGDGSQAVVAALASEHGLPYACVPAGTRNHFALDLGVERDDVVGALDAFVDGGERVVDLAEVNGRVFVNNVSLGLYAEAVQRAGYRDAKLRTLLDTVPNALARGGDALQLGWRDPNGHAAEGAAAVLVSNNRYRLGRAIGSGTRPRLDDGVLGITVVAGAMEPNARRRPWQEWTSASFQVESRGPIPAGVDGEAVRIEPPLHFRSRPRALRVRIAARHPGASPSALEPDGAWDTIRVLVGIAAGRDPRPLPPLRGS